MKKLLVLFCLFFIGVSLIACNKIDSDPDVITISFVPSQSAEVVDAQRDILIAALKSEIPGKDFKILTGVNYTAVTEGLLSGTIDVGFLTAQQYAEVSTVEPGKVEVILTSVRAGYQVAIDHPNDFPAQIAYMNTPAYKGQQATQPVDNYNSICIVRTEDWGSGAGKMDSIEDLVGKTVAVQGTTSGAGYVYPSVALYNAGLSFTTSSPDVSKKEVKAQQVGGYDPAVTSVLDGTVDAAWIFLDVRYANFYNKTGNDYYQVDGENSIFAKTKVIAMTIGIYNDTVSVRSSLSASLIEKLQNAFINITSDQTSEGAKAIYKIYSHTGYVIAKDSDYNGEREVYDFKRKYLS
ncbi:MAG: PhnD/SsuA/transferrin family substrate-binding protein [Acholeplasmatales bacterium]|nr:PhnD/SsuA/transferrin family substrate-binding protein [Acholeplasmatales bacterium]